MLQKTTLRRLPNGMPLLMIENHEAAVATVDVWVRTGAADEPAEINGISHFLEHMLFKGTERYGLGEIERIIENKGGMCNAATSLDFTHYYVTLPSANVDTAINMLAEMVRHSTIDAEELEKERLVILEEYRRKQDHPVGSLYERLYGTVFETGPYHRPVIGSEATIKSITRQQMLDYYHKRYSPASCALVVTGDIDPAAVEARAVEVFAGFDRPLVELQGTLTARYGAGTLNHDEKPTGGECYVTYGFPAPGLTDPDRVLALDVAQFILGHGRSATLYRRIKEDAGLCSSISTYYPTHMHDSLFVIIATCAPDQRDTLREAVLRQLREFTAAPPTEPVMQRAKRLIRSSHIFSMETSGGASSNVGYHYTLTGGIEFLDDYLDRLEAITPQQVQEAARAVLPPEDLEAAMVEVSVGPVETAVG